ncbi:hypothetical protein [Hymenobacter sp. PAMC 26628]|nr:hypothetical protein [Hymenobacter sp. PAMC 26628]
MLLLPSQLGTFLANSRLLGAPARAQLPGAIPASPALAFALAAR